MLKVTAREKIHQQIEDYRRMSYEQLVDCMRLDNHYEFEENNKQYQLEINIVWDDEPKGILRVVAFTDYYKKSGGKLAIDLFTAL